MSKHKLTWEQVSKLILDLETRVNAYTDSCWNALTEKEDVRDSVFICTLKEHFDFEVPKDKPKIPKDVSDALIKDIGCQGKEIFLRHLDVEE